ncbi:MAG: alpha/beta hydrolase [Solobacterium sp.]|nr:alpha/beta hydrolase [Solobacterium sp.]
MKQAVLYIHGKGGSAAESEHYIPLFPQYEVIGLKYTGATPWEAGRQIHDAVEELKSRYERIILIANSIGAFFAMNAEIEDMIDKAYFISPVADMERLILNMMSMQKITEEELKEKGVIASAYGDDLSWEYLSYVRAHPLKWNVNTEILYGENDNLTSFETMQAFAKDHSAGLTVMKGGEHWFHTEEQMNFLDQWIREN